MQLKSNQCESGSFYRRSLSHRWARIGALALSAVTALAPLPSQASLWTCVNVFQSEATSTYGASRKEFDHDSHYSNDLTEQSPIRNQCALGTCHLHSWVSMLEQDHIQDKRKPIVLSTHYLVSQYWLVKSLLMIRAIPTMTKMNRPISLELGASVVGSRAMIQMLGLVPDEVWTGRRDFQQTVTAERITEALQNIIARTRFQYETHPNNADAIFQRGYKEVEAVFKNLIGPIPEKFTYEGKEYTPKTFALEFYPELHAPIVQMGINRARTRSTLVEGDQSITEISTTSDIVESTAKRLIDEGHDVYLAYSHDSNFVDMKTGVMSVAMVHMPRAGRPLDRAIRDRYGLEDGGHAVQIVGYDLDPSTGRVKKWKIKNSWGEAAGDKGYFHMYDDYFRAYARAIVFFNDPSIPLPKSTLSAEPKQLDLPF